MYQGLKDSMLKTDGLWSMKECVSPKCGTYWLDPSPVAEDIHLLYPEYQTHSDPITVQQTKPVGN